MNKDFNQISKNISEELSRLFAEADFKDEGPVTYVQKGAAFNVPSKPVGRRWNIRKLSLPPGVDKEVAFGYESKEEAEYTIETAVDDGGKRIFGLHVDYSSDNDLKTYIFYEPILENASPSERNIYANPVPLMKQEGSDPVEVTPEPDTWIE